MRMRAGTNLVSVGYDEQATSSDRSPLEYVLRLRTARRTYVSFADVNDGDVLGARRRLAAMRK